MAETAVQTKAEGTHRNEAGFEQRNPQAKVLREVTGSRNQVETVQKMQAAQRDAMEFAQREGLLAGDPQLANEYRRALVQVCRREGNQEYREVIKATKEAYKAYLDYQRGDATAVDRYNAALLKYQDAAVTLNEKILKKMGGGLEVLGTKEGIELQRRVAADTLERSGSLAQQMVGSDPQKRGEAYIKLQQRVNENIFDALKPEQRTERMAKALGLDVDERVRKLKTGNKLDIEIKDSEGKVLSTLKVSCKEETCNGQKINRYSINDGDNHALTSQELTDLVRVAEDAGKRGHKVTNNGSDGLHVFEKGSDQVLANVKATNMVGRVGWKATGDKEFKDVNASDLGGTFEQSNTALKDGNIRHEVSDIAAHLRKNDNLKINCEDFKEKHITATVEKGDGAAHIGPRHAEFVIAAQEGGKYSLQMKRGAEVVDLGTYDRKGIEEVTDNLAKLDEYGARKFMEDPRAFAATFNKYREIKDFLEKEGSAKAKNVTFDSGSIRIAHTQGGKQRDICIQADGKGKFAVFQLSDDGKSWNQVSDGATPITFDLKNQSKVGSLMVAVKQDKNIVDFLKANRDAA